jgi:predicted 3-demethylubiquinone-9 3-methyltransferase (glyoxalase superfamily)
MATLMPSLLFVGAQAGRAEEAMELYVSLFPDSRVDRVQRHDDGTILHAHARIAGRDVTFQDSAHPGHAFTFTPAISLTVELADTATLDAAFAALEQDGGMALMPLDTYDFAERFGWVQDRFGVSWQLILAGS